MTEKACPKCRLISNKNVCPRCKISPLSDDFSGLVIILDPKNSAIAKVMKLTQEGRYALRVR